MRRLLVICCLVVFFEVAFFEAITPLLADYRRELGLDTAQAGILVGAYAAGGMLAALPGGIMASRIGPRRTLIIGCLTFGAAAAVFGFAHHIVVLDVARFVHGVAGSLMWSAALTWLIVSAGGSRRGQVIGTALGIAVAGALVGPALGALAVEIGTEPVFSAVAVAVLAVAIAASRLPEADSPGTAELSEITRTILSRPVLGRTVLVILPATMFGVIAVLVPLEVSDLGGGPGLVAAGFASGAAIEAVASPMVGRFTDRHSRLLPYTVGVFVCAIAILLVPAGSIPIVFAALLAGSAGAGLCFTPTMTMLADAAEAAGLHQGFATGLSNLAFSSGQVVGAVGGGALAHAAGTGTPCVIVAAVLMFTGMSMVRRLRRAPAGPAPG